MQTLRKWIRNLFGFSGREVNGFIILLPLMLMLILAQPLYRFWLAHRTKDFREERRELDSLVALWNEKKVTLDSLYAPSRPVLFPFDPNTATLKELRRLGFSAALATRVTNYRQKGGKFRIKADLAKLYGLDSSFYRQLYAYIQLPDQKENHYQNKKLPENRQKPETVLFDINDADTTQLKTVNGIGPVLASRVIKFRDGLGGFIRNEQLNEIYGLDSATVHQLRQRSFIANGFVARQLNINTANEQTLAAHPYIRKSIARAIVAYRFQHGDFKNVEDLSKLTVLKQSDIVRISPYLKVND
jgi:competence protein ComEA